MVVSNADPDPYSTGHRSSLPALRLPVILMVMPNAYSDLCSTGFWQKLCTLGSYDRLSVILMAVSNAHCNHCFRGTKHKRFERTLIYHDTDTCGRLSVTLMIVLTPTMTTVPQDTGRGFVRWCHLTDDLSFWWLCRMPTLWLCRMPTLTPVSQASVRVSVPCTLRSYDWDYPSF